MPRLILIGREEHCATLEEIETLFGDKMGQGRADKVIRNFKLRGHTYVKFSLEINDKVATRAAILEKREAIAAYAMLPQARMEICLAVFDTDSTFIDQEVIDEIAAYANVKDKVAQITERAMRGELDFDAALKERVALLRGISVDALAEILKTRLRVTQGAQELLAWLKSRGAKTYLVSGGFSFFTSALQRAYALTGEFANTLEIVDDRLTGKTIGAIVNRERKAEILSELASQNQIDMAATIAVGDGANDLAMVKASGLGIAFDAKPALFNESFAAVFERDLALIEHLVDA